MPKGQKQLQMQKQISAYSWKTTHEIFIMTMEFLEKYIEVVDYYPDWQQRKQINDNRVQRKDDNLEKAEKSFSTMLFLFGTNLINKPFHEKLKEEFYQWIDATGIRVDKCPERLKRVLYGINEILEGQGQKIREDAKNAKEDYDINSPEHDEALNELFTDMQSPLDNEEKEAKLLEGKNWTEINIGKKFSGDIKQGQEAFEQIKNTISLAEYQNNFHFFPQKEIQQDSSSQKNRVLTKKTKQNMNEWEIGEVMIH